MPDERAGDFWKEGKDMALYALGDMHLSFSVDKPMDIFDPVWKDHEKKIEKYWRKKITPEDTIVRRPFLGKKCEGVRGGFCIY